MALLKRQKLTNTSHPWPKIHFRHENWRFQWIPRICDFRIAVRLSSGNRRGGVEVRIWFLHPMQQVRGTLQRRHRQTTSVNSSSLVDGNAQTYSRASLRALTFAWRRRLTTSLARCCLHPSTMSDDVAMVIAPVTVTVADVQYDISLDVSSRQFRLAIYNCCINVKTLPYS